MAVPTLAAITPQDTLLIVGQAYPQAVAIPATGNPTTLLFTCLGLPGIVALTTASATTTATQATVGARTITVAANTDIAVGQIVAAVGIQPGTVVTAIASDVISISKPTTAVLSSAAVNFIAPIYDPSDGVAVTANFPLAVVIGSNTFIVYISASGGYGGYGGNPGSTFQSQINVVAFT